MQTIYEEDIYLCLYENLLNCPKIQIEKFHINRILHQLQPKNDINLQLKYSYEKTAF